jgi:hypothetical protein
MAGMGALPKPADQRARRNPTIAMQQLPAEGYSGPVPDWPFDDHTAAELKRWRRLWSTPQAAMWAKNDMGDLVARYVRNCLLIETSNSSVALAYITAEVRQQEDRLGRSPLALMRLRWEISSDEVGAVRDLNERRGTRDRLKAVDPKLAKES